jgi:hypothetical protein
MKRVIYLGLLIFSFGCEKTIEINKSIATSVVVEGYIEFGPEAFPPYVILTKDFVFRNDSIAINDLFITDAHVSVKDENDINYILEKVCWADLSPDEKNRLALSLGLNQNQFRNDFCIYIDIFQKIKTEVGKRYDLNIEVDGKKLSAATTIPRSVPLDSILWKPTPAASEFLQLRGFISDPGPEPDFYRYQTRINAEPFLSAFNSVTDDALFNGICCFQFPIPKGELRDPNLDPKTIGFYPKRKNLTIKWYNVDGPHFRFWRSLEFNQANQGPFATYTRVESNIKGGLGIWGGQNVRYYRFRIPD